MSSVATVLPTEQYPLISVIIPVYNAEQFLERTVQTVQEQTYPNLEILLIDDGSTDGSLPLCRQIAQKDARIRVFHKENGGLSSARNCGVQHAAGEYVGFVDSDDLIYPDMYENLWNGCCRFAEKAEDKPLFIQIGREEIDEQGSRLPDAVTPPEEAVLISPEEFQKSLLLYTGDVSFCTKLIPRRFMEEHPFEEGVLAEDFSLQMKLLDALGGIVLLPQVGYRVVHRAGSLTRRSNPSQFSKVYISIVEHADYVEHELVPRYPGLREAALRFGLFERLDYLLHVPIADMTASNLFYRNVVRYLRGNFTGMLRCPYLTVKNKLYLLLLTIAPRLTRQIHWRLRGKKILAEGQQHSA